MKISSASVALVTGGSQGIGKAVVAAFLDLGARVSFLDINKEQGEEVQKTLLEKYGEGRSIFIPCDVSNEHELRGAFEKTKTTFGKINIVCNIAGILDEKNWEEMVDINLKGVMRGTFLGLEYMSSKHGNEGGVVINTSSRVAIDKLNYMPSYCATKSGVLHFTRCLEEAVKSDRVRVVCVCPGGINTSMTKGVFDEFPQLKTSRINELIEPDDIAQHFVKLAEDDDNAGKVYECRYWCKSYIEFSRPQPYASGMGSE